MCPKQSRRRNCSRSKDLSVQFTSGGKATLAVDRVSFHINKGETIALVGESGSGKSVTALSVMQLLPYPAASHPSGSIVFRGEEFMGADQNTLRRIRGNDVSIIFQEPMTSLNPLHTIEKQVGEILTLHRGLTDKAAKERGAGASKPGWNPGRRKKDWPATPTSCPAVSASAS